MSSVHKRQSLHSENFDLCRICLAEPESDRNLDFIHMVGANEGNFQLIPQFEELLGIKVELNDVKPKIICNNCFKSLFAWYEMKKKAKESEIVINYIAAKKFGANNPGTPQASNSSATWRDIKPIEKNINLNASMSASTSRASTSRPSTSRASTSRPSTSRASTSRPSTSRASPSRASTSRASTSRASTSRASTSRTSTSRASTSGANTSRASTSRNNYNHGHPSRAIITTFSRVESDVEESDDDCIEIQNSVNTAEPENYSGHGIEESESDMEESESEMEEREPDINNTNNELDCTADHESDINYIKYEVNESADNSFFPEPRDLPQTSGYINNQNRNTNIKLYYCNICQKDNVLDHKCFEYNKNFSTCLVPKCNILSRSINDFMLHYQLHIGVSPSAVMCKRCYQKIEQSDFSVNGCHVQCRKVYPFKCFVCNIIFKNMGELAFHKLKNHNGQLMDSENNYLCVYCEEYSPDITDIVNHMNTCLEDQSKNVPHTIRMKMPAIDKTKLIPIEKITQKKKKKPVQRKKRTKKNFLRTSKMVLFTCLKPSCNLVFQSFPVFKLHHREHFGLGDRLVCWQCCIPFDDLNTLRTHQVRSFCRIPGMFKCGKCPENFDDVQCLGIHKYTFHDGTLITAKKNNITIKCPICKLNTSVNDFKSHLTTCQSDSILNNTTNSTNNLKGAYKCGICDKTFNAVVSLSNHSRVHKPHGYRKSKKNK